MREMVGESCENTGSYISCRKHLYSFWVIIEIIFGPGFEEYMGKYSLLVIQIPSFHMHEIENVLESWEFWWKCFYFGLD